MSASKEPSCGCGAFTATPAALASMSPAERADFNRKVKGCQTCAQDARSGRS